MIFDDYPSLPRWTKEARDAFNRLADMARGKRRRPNEILHASEGSSTTGPYMCVTCGQMLEPITEGVDIGVGTQEHLTHYECANCGPVGVCYSCGVPDSYGHTEWCVELQRARTKEDE